MGLTFMTFRELLLELRTPIVNERDGGGDGVVDGDAHGGTISDVGFSRREKGLSHALRFN